MNAKEMSTIFIFGLKFDQELFDNLTKIYDLFRSL